MIFADLFGDLSHGDRHRGLVTDITPRNRHRQLSRPAWSTRLKRTSNVRSRRSVF